MGIPIEMKQSRFNDLVNLCTEIKNVYSDGQIVNSEIYMPKFIAVINNIFDELQCTEVIFTNNTDKLVFGIHVTPTLLDHDTLNLIMSTEPCKSKRYAVDIDLRLFDKFNDMEVATYIIEDIASLFYTDAFEEVRRLFDVLLASEGEYIEVKQSVNYTQILTFGIKDALRKLTSLLYKDEEAAGINIYAQGLEIADIARDIASSVKSFIFEDTGIETNTKMSILQWALMVYKDIDTNYSLALDTLENAKIFTGSELERREIEKTEKSIRRAVSEIMTESAILRESLFEGLKKKGLRQIEDDIYEYRIRLKNCEDQDEAMYILHQINTRVGILEDYIATNELSEAEILRWRRVIEQYQMLRVELSKKKIGGKKQYGIFVDYDKLDRLDNPNEP